MPPPKAGEAAIIAVGRNPLAAGFDGERRQVSVRNQVASGLSLTTKVRENLPVTRPRRDRDAVRLEAKTAHSAKRLLQRRWRSENSRMSHDPHEGRQYKVGDSKRLTGTHLLLKPALVRLVVWRLGAVGINEHVDVKEYHSGLP